MADCKNCLHYEVCADVMKKDLFIKEKMLKIANPICKCFLDESRIIELPCKVGDICWFIRNNKIIKTTVEKIVLKEKGRLYLKLSCNSLYETSCRSIEKTVFFTYEEAEQALKERD